MVRTWMLAVVIALSGMSLGVVASGQEMFTPSWIGQVSGNPDVFKVAAFYQPAARAQVGLEIGYWDGLKPEQKQAVTFEVVGKYFALDKQPLNLYVFSVDASAYVGLGLGAEVAKGQALNDIADMRTGLVFGDGPVTLGIEYEYVLTDLMWAGAANGDHRVLGTIAYEFGGKK